MKRKALDRFWSKVDVGGRGECWTWKAATNAGYGWISIGGKQRLAHRVSAEIAGLRIDGLCVLHRCDVRRCVNPAHLFVGTRTDNHADMMAKGRHSKGKTHADALRKRRRWSCNRGESHAMAKLTNRDVLEIRKEARLGSVHRVIADAFGVERSVITNIVNRKTWKHVQEESR